MNTNCKKTLYFGGDHCGYKARMFLIEKLSLLGYKCIHVGSYNELKSNYAKYAIETAQLVAKDSHSYGMLVCGTGVGVCMAANKVKNILAGVAYNNEVARLIKQHDNCNVLALGARQFSLDELLEMCLNFLNSDFEKGRHEERINTIIEFEKN